LIWIALGGQADALAVDDEGAVLDGDLALEAAVDRVVLEQVGQVVRLEQVVDADHLDVVTEVLHRRAQDVAPDAPETVDANLDRHFLPGSWRSVGKARHFSRSGRLAPGRGGGPMHPGNCLRLDPAQGRRRGPQGK